MVCVFREVKRVLRKDGTLWLNLGDSYAGSGCGTNDYRTEASRSINKSDKMFTKTPPQQKIIGNGYKPKDLIGIPWRVAFALQADGWYLRSDIIWHKPNPMPESVKDRPTKSHEYIFLLTKSARYYYDGEAIKEESVTNEGRPDGIVRDRIYDYDSKQKYCENKERRKVLKAANLIPEKQQYTNSDVHQVVHELQEIFPDAMIKAMPVTTLVRK